MDEAEYESCDLDTLRFLAEFSSCEIYRFPSAHKSRRDHDILAGLVVSEEIKRCISVDPCVVAASVRARGIDVKPKQIRDYFRGRFTPGADVVGRIANAFACPEIRTLLQMPWHLLADQALSLKEIKKTRLLRPGDTFRPSKMSNQSTKAQCARHLVGFNPSENWLNAPAKPEEFWQPLAAYRAALVLNDYHSANTHYWRVISNVPSIATHPAVIPHVERLYACVRILTRNVDRQFLWFSVDWDIVRDTIKRRNFGPDASRCKPFSNIFRGTTVHRGRAFQLTDIHNYIEQRHPRLAAELKHRTTVRVRS